MNKIIYILTIIFLLIAKINFAQQEIPNYSQSNDTCVPANINDYNRLIKYFIADKQDVQQLLKFDFLQFALMRPNISYERKLTDNTTIDIQALLGTYSNSFNYETVTGIHFSTLYVLLNSIDFKYYYNKKHRIEKDKNTNGFSANYFSMGIGAYTSIYLKNQYEINFNGSLSPKYHTNYYTSSHLPYNVQEPQKLVWRTKRFDPNESIGFVRIGYGLQRRIGKIGYVGTDLNFGVGTNWDFSRLYLMPEFTIKAGFAISFSKNRAHKKD